MKIKTDKIVLRTIETSDIDALYKIAYQGDLEWMKWNGPYFKDPMYTYDEFTQKIAPSAYVNCKDCMLVEYEDRIIGLVTYYFDDGKLAKWPEVGILLYSKEDWNKGLGTHILKLWIQYVFTSLPDIEHVGFTTWSKNVGMARVGEKVGMQLEGRIRKVRYWEDMYWDSLKFGILRDEYEIIEHQVEM
ncbi:MULTISPECIES: GNAT family protein [unclassified Breznakia]|uniref:GNAT family N-acetyltransferase n=1 Tax=unclassified Breznakia TaxID=2623764 RepID=UPI0024771EB1|nr:MULTISPECIES: GNAT family protein [unclassified Breznakia]MDH6367211.1 RimJ/RimL family protein N-acetyltransferase [Breznakia sp. PH1-1]MDH6404369.1 RimJ/RimL family protein N-acetyltransferase [Breznakia sp. PF1-11]MDH6412078.1 RimJ/RimL family protein N-acetyltransferase [Breznakia sp. PFB1-11]MDH6414357.1 RimJ/RimL family protein N-acetyltransferase [Breznakia sp. PFB1-14]MDH6416713.1 RimJ/RimL family protein N-acetyltransferase [Breznakia sp. PFB1-4]